MTITVKSPPELLSRYSASDRIDLSQDHILCGDSIELLKRVPSDSVHLILSDIPYGIGLDDWDVLHDNTNSAFLGSSPAQVRAGAVFKKRGKPINGWSDADKEIPREYYEWCKTWASEWLRILKPGGSAIVFAGRRYSPRCVVALEDAGFNFRDMLAWVRPRAVHRAQRVSIVFERRGDGKTAKNWEGWRVGNLTPNFEPIIWCFKPYRITIADNLIEHEVGAFNQRALAASLGSSSNVISCGMAEKEGGFHPAQKPLKLMECLIELVTKPGQIVLDPFAGSGSSVVAARKLQRRFLAIDKDVAHCRTIEERVSEAKQSDLFSPSK